MLVLITTGDGRPAGSDAPGSGGRGFLERLPEDTVAGFYHRRTVRLIVGSAAGGGYDLYARLIARHLQRHIPGRPTVIVENMPGAGSIRAANYVYMAAPRDGTVIAALNSHIVHQQIFGAPGVLYDAGRLRVMTVPVGDVYLLVVTRKAGVRRFEELLGPSGRPIVIGVTAGGTELGGLLLRDGVRANVKVVAGYDGTSAIRLAMESGEVDAMFLSWASASASSPEKFTSGEWVMLAQFTDEPLDDLRPFGVPAIPALGVSDEQRQLLRYGIAIPSSFARLFVVTPEVPDERAAALERALAGVLADPDLLADAAGARMAIAPIPGNEVERLVRQYLDMPPTVKASIERALAKRSSDER
jgi:tripartite-type tricarboxylate transporter receptor subunit TctC